MKGNMRKDKQVKKGGNSASRMESNDQMMEFRKIIKDVEVFGLSHMTWKERKEVENKRVVSLGGKPIKKQRLPLSVARVAMKNQKQREEKILQENLILGRFGGKNGSGGGSKRTENRRRPEDRVLKASEGNFKNGVLDVKHLLRSAPSKDINTRIPSFGEGKSKKGNGKQNRGKKKGGGKKKHH